jgi:hypothetical protein
MPDIPDRPPEYVFYFSGQQVSRAIGDYTLRHLLVPRGTYTLDWDLRDDGVTTVRIWRQPDPVTAEPVSEPELPPRKWWQW